MNLQDLQRRLREFNDERDWNQFHSPKNLAMALSVEVAELLEHFQWLTEEESYSSAKLDKVAVAEEIADIQIYLTMIAAKFEVDIEKAVTAKIDTNAVKHPPKGG